MEEINIKMPAMEKVLSKLGAIEQKLDELKNQNPLQDVWLDTREASKALGISTRTLQEKRNRGEISFSRSRNTIRYRAEDIQQYLMDHFVKSRNKEEGKHD